MVSATDNGQYHSHRKMGLVGDVFKPHIVEKLPGTRAIGHVRYGTSGGSEIKNAQPFVVETGAGPLAVAHNGNLTNAVILRRQLEASGSIFQSSSDTEVVIHLVARSTGSTMVEKICDALRQIEGAFSLVLMTAEGIYAARDPHGFRPLVLGQMDGVKVVASETCALDIVGASYIREIEPGELLVIRADAQESIKPFAGAFPRTACIFEQIYFARPDSTVFGQDVYRLRQAFGRQLARESAVEADVVSPVPDSGVPAAMGYAAESGIPYELGLVRNHYVGRTFIQPAQEIRNLGVRMKLNPVRSVLGGKRVVVIDDSIVRGTTSQKIIQTIRDAGAREIHVRISSPPITDPCYYGIDTPDKAKLVAANYSIDEIRRYIGADTLAYLSEEGMLAVAGGGGYCTACFNGRYPLPNSDLAVQRNQMRLFEL